MKNKTSEIQIFLILLSIILISFGRFGIISIIGGIMLIGTYFWMLLPLKQK